MEPQQGISESTRHALLFHGAFAALSILILAVAPFPKGLLVLGLVVVYNVALPAIAHWLEYPRWSRVWAFLVPLCVFQIVPEGFMDTVLNAVRFPQRDGPMIGPIPLAMVGLWMMPLWLSLYAGREAAARGWRGTLVASLVSGVVLLVANVGVALFPFWQPVGVHTLGPVPIYLIIPGFLVGAAAYVAETRTRGEARTVRVIAAGTVAVFYLGTVASSYYFFERIVP